jgi:hypothetical protein
VPPQLTHDASGRRTDLLPFTVHGNRGSIPQAEPSPQTALAVSNGQPFRAKRRMLATPARRVTVGEKQIAELLRQASERLQALTKKVESNDRPIAQTKRRAKSKV